MPFLHQVFLSLIVFNIMTVANPRLHSRTLCSSVPNLIIPVLIAGIEQHISQMTCLACCLFNDVGSNFDYVASNGGMVNER